MSTSSTSYISYDSGSAQPGVSITVTDTATTTTTRTPEGGQIKVTTKVEPKPTESQGS